MADKRSNHASLAVLSLTLVVSIALVFGFFGRFHPALDSFSHFRLHLALLLGLCAVALFVWHLRIHALAAFVLAAACGVVTLAPFYTGHNYAGAPTDQPVYRLLQFNLSQRNPDPKAVLSMIARQRPDILTLNEISDEWRTELDTIKMAYPYRLDCSSGELSTVILSRRPMNLGHNSYCTEDGGFAFAQVDLHGRLLNVFALHLTSPWPFGQAKRIGEIAPLLRLTGEDAIAAGDLKAVPWSAAARAVAALGGFDHIAYAGATWFGHRAVPPFLRFLGLPIDAVMSKGKVVVHSVKTLDNAGSDHLPLLMEFSLTPEEPAAPPTHTASLI